MKSIAIFLILSIISLTFSKNILDNYSINLFIDYLKRQRLFKIIKSIKYKYGQDVAIISCEELNKNYCGNCKKVVTDYMPIDDNKILYPHFINSKGWVYLKKCLGSKFSSEETQLKYKRIIEKYKKRKILNKNKN